MIYVSNFASLRKIDKDNKYKDLERVAIVRYKLKFLDNFSNLKFDRFIAPSSRLLDEFKACKVNQDFYKRVYLKKLDKIGHKKLYSRYKNKILLCYCGKGKFCHRYLFMDYMLKNGYNVKEI